MNLIQILVYGARDCTLSSLLRLRLLLHLLLLHLLLNLLLLVPLVLLLLSLRSHEQTISFLNLIGQVRVVTNEFVKINNSCIEEHTCDLTSCIMELSLNASKDGVSDGLFLFVLVLNCENCRNISLDGSQLRLRSRHILELLLLLLWLHLHWHSVGNTLRSLVINTLLLVHVASTTSTSLSSLTLVASVALLHVVVLIMLIKVTLRHQNFSKSHGERIAIHVGKLFLCKHLKHLAVLLLFLLIDVFLRHPEVNVERLASKNVRLVKLFDGVLSI